MPIRDVIVEEYLGKTRAYSNGPSLVPDHSHAHAKLLCDYVQTAENAFAALMLLSVNEEGESLHKARADLTQAYHYAAGGGTEAEKAAKAAELQQKFEKAARHASIPFAKAIALSYSAHAIRPAASRKAPGRS
jgi:tryptophan synthase alpha subunit